MNAAVVLVIICMVASVKCFREEKIPGQNNDIERPYITGNCKQDKDITHHDNCPGYNDAIYKWCYHIEAIGESSYPEDGFCLMEDTSQGIETNVVAYTMNIRMHNDYTNAGIGIYFNYQDSQNYDVVYKIDQTSRNCIIGYVENGIVVNSTASGTFDCGTTDSSDWLMLKVYVSEDRAAVTFNRSQTFTFTPHFPMRAKAGPAELNAYGNQYLHCQNIILTTETCQENDESDLCHPCNYTYNVQSTPAYPLPNHRNFLLWYPRALEMVYTACYIKVTVSKEVPLINVKSKVGEFNRDGNINVGDLYGERNQCPEKGMSCIEIKIGGSVTDGDLHDEDKTLIEVTAQNATNITVNSNLKLIYQGDIVEERPQSFKMYVHHKVYGSDFGIYCRTEKENPMKAQEKAYSMCMTGTNSNCDYPVSNNNGWALQFN